MKLRNKAAISAGILCAAFLGCYYLLEFLLHMNNFESVAILAICFSLVAFFILGMTIARRIEQLNQGVTRISFKNTLDSRLDIKGNDEISSIGRQINKILSNVQASYKELEMHSTAKALELESKNKKLQEDISARNRTDKIATDNLYLKHLSRHDILTSLPNGVFFNEILNKSINHSRRRNQYMAILLIDLDMFQSISATIGQVNSDLVLKEIGKRFSNVIRKEDILAKLDGDEFIILLNDIGKPKFASAVAEKILNICSQLIKVEHHEFSITASIGIAIYPNDGDSLEKILENADRALFKAKQSGGGCYQFHTEEIHAEATEYIQLESALRKAIHNNELALYFQPMFRLSTGVITGVEALMRWEHPALGIINPSKFIPLAEESGTIMQVGEWAIREACEKIRFWQDEGYEHVSIALKLSQKQFNHPDIAKIIAKAIKGTGINPKYIQLEITERTVMENVELAFSILENLRATGVLISIDHFGVGYTSISYLKHFPITSIKIDQSFIKGIPNNPDDTAITSAVISLAHNLGLEVIAEGVETAEQVQYLTSQNCDVMQGYFLSHPVSSQKIILQFKKLREEVLM
jgi:diguanylate cyclase (GGDEF)-like protein